MHIGGVLLFEGPPPPFEDLLAHVRERLDRVPRYRQKLATPPLDSGRPLWVDDADFNLEYHVRQTALPQPGTEAQLWKLASRLAAQRLDRSKPLWELWVVEGIEPREGDGSARFALIAKNHHSLVDGVSSFDLATALFDIAPQPAATEPQAAAPWRPQPEPGRIELLAAGIRGAVRTGADLAGAALKAATTPARSAQIVRDAAEGVGSLAWAILNPAPETPLNVPIGPHRRYAVIRLRLSDFKTIKREFGGTVNDVVLTAVTGGLREWLHARGFYTEGVELRALVPVSVRERSDANALGNKLTLMRAPLPVYIPEPVTALRVISRAMDDLKASKQAVGAATLAAANALAPPAVLAQASRLQFSPRLFNLLVTNIPGPQFPLYVLGRRLTDLFPLPFLAERQALAVAIISYDGLIEFGLLGDYDALADLELIAAGIGATVDALLDAAVHARGPVAEPPPRPTTSDTEARDGAIDRSSPALPPAGGHRERHGPASEMRATKRARRRPG